MDEIKIRDDSFLLCEEKEVPNLDSLKIPYGLDNWIKISNNKHMKTFYDNLVNKIDKNDNKEGIYTVHDKENYLKDIVKVYYEDPLTHQLINPKIISLNKKLEKLDNFTIYIPLKFLEIYIARNKNNKREAGLEKLRVD